MRTHKWSEIKKKRYAREPERLERIEREVEREVLDMNLRAMREMVGKTQVEAAEVAELTQGEISRAERRSDHLLSTLRRYVNALGGELEVVAHFGDKRIRLTGV